MKDPNADLNTFMERMTAMVDAEWQARADKRFNRLMKEAHLRYPVADLDETIYRPERQLDTQIIERSEYLPLDRGRKKSHCNRFFCQWKNVSDQCFLHNCNEAVQECKVYKSEHTYE
nr:hypothetical protein [Blautia sp. LMAG:36]